MSKEHKGIENKDYIREMHGLRSSNASGTHKDKRTRRVRTRYFFKESGHSLLSRWPLSAI